MNKPKPVILKDNEFIKNVIIQLDMKLGKTMVMSNYSSWDNLAYIMEGLACTAQKCIDEGIPKAKVYKAITDYLMQALGDYRIKKID